MLDSNTRIIISELFFNALDKSPFYQEHYKTVDKNNLVFEDLPIATLDKINEIRVQKNKGFYSNKNIKGICFSSSGTTGFAKSSFFDRNEWITNNRRIALSHFNAGTLKKNDVVANLAYGGHASFMAVHCTLQEFPEDIAEISIGADRDFESVINILTDFKVTVIAGIYSTFIGLANHMIRNNIINTNVTQLLGGGELLYGSQVEFIRLAFPNADVRPFVTWPAKTSPTVMLD